MRTQLLEFLPFPQKWESSKQDGFWISACVGITRISSVVLIVFCILFLSAVGFSAHWFYFRSTASYTFVSSSEQVELIPVIRLEFNEATFFKDWNEHSFSGKSDYKIQLDENGEEYLHASSKAASSVLLRQVSVPMSERPFLTWEWKTAQFPLGKKNQRLGAKSDNDFAMRVYAIFGGGLPFNSEVIQYVWDEHFPEGTFAIGAFSGKSRVFVVQSGKAQTTSGWVSEKRDLALDYRELFGKPFKGNLAAIGIMSDSDNTGTQSEAFVRRLEIQKPRDITLLESAGFGKDVQKGNFIVQIFETVRNGIQNGVQNSVRTGFRWFETLRDQIGDQANRRF